MYFSKANQELLGQLYPVQIVQVKPRHGMSVEAIQRMLPHFSRLWLGSKLSSKSLIEARAIASMQFFNERYRSAVASSTPLMSFSV